MTPPVTVGRGTDLVVVTLATAALVLALWLLAAAGARLAIRHHPGARRVLGRLPRWLLRPALGLSVVAAGLGAPPEVAGADPDPARSPAPEGSTDPHDDGPTAGSEVPWARMVPLDPDEPAPAEEEPPPAPPGRSPTAPAPPSRRAPTASPPGPPEPRVESGDAGPAPPPTAPADAPGAPTGDPARRTDTSDEPAVVWMVALDDEAGAGGDPPNPEAGADDEAGAGDVPAADTWEVALGDHLWAVAAESLADAGRPTDDRTVLGYWTALVDANRDRLVDPENPDLILPGQVLVLPPVSDG